VSLLREGAKQVKEARTDDKGNFIAKGPAGTLRNQSDCYRV
jgi:hypothetical protein